MYSFLFDQTYINLLILIVIVSLVMFLWRKLIILEGNFFILEKRVNIIKKDFREDSIAKNIEASECIMNEIFKDCPAINACKQFECFAPNIEFPQNGKNNSNNLSVNEDMVQYISIHASDNIDVVDDKHNAEVAISEVDVISFINNDDVHNDDKVVKNISSGVAEDASYAGEAGLAGEVKGDVDNVLIEHCEPDNMSVSSEITFTSDDKKKKKKK